MRRMVNSLYLAKKNNEGRIIEAIKFTQDSRSNIDKKYAEINKMSGCIWYNDYKYFETKEDGNNFYKECLANGFIKSDSDEFDKFTHRCAILTY